jgi:uroporphyrinogen decarboxylase
MGGDNLNKEAENILLAFKNKPHIFNLGHGVLPETPTDNVKQLINKIRGNL